MKPYFSKYLKELDEKERLAKETAENTAVRNYVEWAAHFELLNESFGQLHSLFKGISGNVANWRLSDGSNILGSLGWDQDRGYYFRTGIVRINPSTMNMDKSIKVEFPFKNDGLSGIGDERLVYKRDMTVASTLMGIDKIKKGDRLTEANSESLLNRLDYCDLTVDAMCDDGNSRFRLQRQIGYLYNHNLADDCEQVFMLMNDGKLDQKSMDKIFTPGNYPRQSGNIRLQNDDNLIDKDNDKDPNWRNG